MIEKELSEMSLEELWQLFPIFLTSHNPDWKKWYQEEKENLESILAGLGLIRISHIGSTAIETIWAKPIVDILVELPDKKALIRAKTVLEANGYICMSQSDDRKSMNKGYTSRGFAERVFHIHLRVEGDHDELYFRDYLIAHPDIAKEYEVLKLRLWKEYEHDRDGYTDAKGEFVRKQTQKAKLEFKNQSG